MLLKNQQNISAQIPMPVEDFHVSSYIYNRTGESISFYNFNTQEKSLTAGQVTNPSGTTLRFTPSTAHSFVVNQKVIITASNNSNLSGEWTISAVSGTTWFEINMETIFSSLLPVSLLTATVRASFPIRAQDSGQAAGTLTVGTTLKKGILDLDRSGVASYRNTSFAWVNSLAFPNAQVRPFDYSQFAALQDFSAYDRAVALTREFSNGDWTMDYRTGTFWGLKATTHASDTCNYAFRISSNSDDPFYQWQRVQQTPTISSVNALTNAVSTALEASRVVKASAGRLYKLFVYNNAGALTFIQIHNTASVPADGVAPFLVYQLGANASYQLDFDVYGLYLATGITIVNSSDAATKTLGGANLWITALYQ